MENRQKKENKQKNKIANSNIQIIILNTNGRRPQLKEISRGFKTD